MAWADRMIRLLNSLSHVNFPEIARWHSSLITFIIAWLVKGIDVPLTFAFDKCRSIIQFVSSSSSDMTPFSDMGRLVKSPLTTWNRQSRIIISHPLERATRFGEHICQVGEVLDHSFSGVVGNCGHVKCTPQFLTAVESKLCKWKMASEFLQGTNGDSHLVTFVRTNFPVRFFGRCFNCRVNCGYDARNKKPSSWQKY